MALYGLWVLEQEQEQEQRVRHPLPFCPLTLPELLQVPGDRPSWSPQRAMTPERDDCHATIATALLCTVSKLLCSRSPGHPISLVSLDSCLARFPVHWEIERSASAARRYP